MSTETTQKALVGTWRLTSFHLRTLTGELTYPFGPDAVGYYIFSESGHMSVAIMEAHRPQFVAGDILGGSTEEKVAAAEGYISYSGKYEFKATNWSCTPKLVFFPTGWEWIKSGFGHWQVTG